MKQYGLIGYPLSHSFSPRYFADKFAREAIHDCSYEAFAIPTIDALKLLLANNPMLHGINVTIPYKKEVVPYLTSTDQAVQQIQACNCIKIKNGELHGFNTDIIGFKNSLLPLLKTTHTNALILGTGGAAVAVEFALQQLNISYLFVSRDGAGKNNCIAYSQVANYIKDHTLIINTTPIGTYPNVDDCPDLPYVLFGTEHYLFDLVYNPAETKFLQLGKKQGATIKNGEEMLYIQAEESWRIWNDESL